MIFSFLFIPTVHTCIKDFKLKIGFGLYAFRDNALKFILGFPASSLAKCPFAYYRTRG